MRILITSLILLATSVLFSQTISIPLARAIYESEPEEQIIFYVKGNTAQIIAEVEKRGGEYRHIFHGFISVALESNEIEGFIKLECVKQLSFQYHRPVLLSDSMRAKSNVVPVYNGEAPLPNPYRGKDVVIGIIDTGIDFTHPDFIDSLGNTKVMYIWDQTIGSPTNTPANFSYGEEWDSTDINLGVCTHVDPSSYYGHGTNVSAMAASNGNATNSHYGTAPDANLIVVASNFNSANWLGTIADAVEYIYSKADSMGLPCVINISAGTYGGSHDGLDLDALRIDSLMKAKTGRALVCAAGNAGSHAAFHLGYDLSADTSFTWFEFNSSIVIPGYAPSGCVYFELYADTADFDSALFSFGADLIGTPYQNRGTMQYLSMPGFYDGSYSTFIDGNGIFVDSITNSLGQKIADVAIGYYKVNDDETYVMQVIINPDSLHTDYEWSFLTTGLGKFDVWSTSNGILGYSDMVDTIPNSTVLVDSSFYKYPDLLQSIVGSFTCLPDVITVGNYVNLSSYIDVQGNLQTPIGQPSGELYSSSSKGPTRIGVTKPTVVGPGSTTMVATRMVDLASMLTNQPSKLALDSMHRTANGTSIASPGVAGVVALLFESCLDYDYAHIKSALTNGAKEDNNTGPTPNNYYGYGKVDAMKSIMQTSSQVSLIGGAGTILEDSLSVCAGDQLEMNQQFLRQRWNTGDSLVIISVAASGLYYGSGIDVNGCLQSSDTVELIIDPFTIPAPTLNINDSLTCENDPITIATLNPYFSYLWSTGANSSTITTSNSGSYRVLVTDIDGCKAYSDTVELTFLINPPTPSITVLNDTILTSTVSSLYQWYFDNAIIPSEVSQILYAQDTGYYYVEVFHPNGCSTISDSVFVVLPLASSIIGKTNNQIAIYPNPFDDILYLQIDKSNRITNVEVHNELGMKLLSVPISDFENPTITEIGMSGFSSGVYFLYFRGAKKNWVQKVIKK